MYNLPNLSIYDGSNYASAICILCRTISEEAKTRYKEKISLINGNDPFGKVVGGEAFSGIVPVDACDLVSYLVLQTSFMTSEQFKARKGLEAYNQFVSGWIKDVSTMKISEKYFTTA